MTKKKRKASTKPAAHAATPAPQNPPEPRPTFHVERNATPAGDYQIRISLSSSMPQELLCEVTRPNGQSLRIAKATLANAQPITSDGAKQFGVPPGLDPHFFREFLESCRQWVQDDARR